jgi:hypothetical protein
VIHEIRLPYATVKYVLIEAGSIIESGDEVYNEETQEWEDISEASGRPLENPKAVLRRSIAVLKDQHWEGNI